jgi:DNA-binding transcriptional MerR regulator
LVLANNIYLSGDAQLGKSADAFRTISEAAADLGLPQHVLRFWETRFSQIKPLKRGGGRRYYRPEDVLLLKGICYLLYDQGFTIKGVQRILKEQGPRHVIAIGEAGSMDAVGTTPAETAQGAKAVSDLPRIGEATGPGAVLTSKDREILSETLRELLDCKRLLDNAREG